MNSRDVEKLVDGIVLVIYTWSAGVMIALALVGWLLTR